MPSFILRLLLAYLFAALFHGLSWNIFGDVFMYALSRGITHGLEWVLLWVVVGRLMALPFKVAILRESDRSREINKRCVRMCVVASLVIMAICAPSLLDPQQIIAIYLIGRIAGMALPLYWVDPPSFGKPKKPRSRPPRGGKRVRRLA